MNKKTALVTGGSGDIGRAICRRIGTEGIHVLVHYNRNRQHAEETVVEIQKEGGSAEAVFFDLADTASIQQFFSSWKDEHPDDSIDILINNAGINDDNLMVFMDDDQWEKVIRINLNGFFYVTRAVLKEMLMNKWGRIVNIVSLSGISGMPGQTNYAATKGGIIAATKSLASEVGKKGITVNAVAPGYIRGEMTRELDEKELKKNIPLNRFGMPEEVAEVVEFLISSRASYITGETISVNGGIYM